MPAEALRAVHTRPHVLVVDLVVVLGGDFNTPRVDRVVLEGLFAFQAPLLEACTVRVVVDFGDHVVG